MTKPTPLLDEEQAVYVRRLRETARAVMAVLAPFNPYLAGSVLDGTVHPYGRIDLLVFADSAKELEIFLLDQEIDFVHEVPRNEKAEAVLVLTTEVAEVNVVVYPTHLERVAFKYRDGRPRDRIRLPALEALLAPEVNTQGDAA